MNRMRGKSAVVTGGGRWESDAHAPSNSPKKAPLS